MKTYTMITGATGRLGASFALDALCRGENLFLTGRSAGKLDELKTVLLSVSPKADVVTFPCDLTDEKSRDELYAFAEGLCFSRLINVAGADIQKPFSEYDQRKLSFQIRVLYEAAASTMLFAVSHKAESLKIVNVSSVCGLYPMPCFAVYASAKGALTSLSVALNREFKGRGVSVCAVLPGSIYTRADVIEYIGKQGLWGKIAAKPPEYVVQKARRASDRGKDRVVVGGANRIMRLFTRLIPEKIRLNFIAKHWSKTRKDAF